MKKYLFIFLSMLISVVGFSMDQEKPFLDHATVQQEEIGYGEELPPEEIVPLEELEES